MKKNFRRVLAGVLTGVMLIQAPCSALADSEKVVTLGADLTAQQRADMLEYFGVTENDVTIIEVNNQEERSYLQGIATESEIGTHTYSCAYIMPTTTKKINVRTAHLTWVSTSMIANTLVTAGIDSCDVIAAAPKDVSGTGALTGIIKAYEKVTDEKLDSEKTELAMKELYDTAELGSDIGQDEASALMNEVKTQVLKDGLTDKDEVKDVVQDVADYYNVDLTDQQKDQVSELMSDIGKQDYNYDDIKNTMGNLQDKLVNNIGDVKESFDKAEAAHPGFFAAIGRFFVNLFKAIADFFSGSSDDGEDIELEPEDQDSILNDVDDSALGIEATKKPNKEDTTDAKNEETISATTVPEETVTEAPATDNTTQQDSFSVDENNNAVQQNTDDSASVSQEVSD